MSVPLRRSAPNDYRGFIPQRPMSGGPMVAPPLPPRTSVSIGTPGSIYGTQFGGSYGSPYSGGLFGPSYNMGYSFRSPYSSRYGYGDYGSDDPHSPFQSVESIVRAISSLSMMVESTYQSMSMSFQAVLGVAENMDQLRRIVLDICGSLTLVKTFFWFCKKILYILGLMKNNPVREKAWEAAAAEVVGSSPAGATRRTWPLIAFFGLMCGGPYILYKLASPVNQPPWDPKVDGGIKCVAVHDFDSVRQGDLSFRRREVLIRHNQLQGGWALACNKNGRIGYVPADRLKPISQTPTGARGDFPVKVYTQSSYDADWIDGPNGNPVPNYTFGVADARIPSSVPVVNVPQCEDGTYTGTYMMGTHPVSRVVRPSPPAAPSAAARPTTSSETVKSDNPTESATILTDPNQQD